MRSQTHLVTLLLAAISAGYYGCSEWAWETMYNSHSPGRTATIEVQEDLPRIGPDSVIRVRLKTGIKSTTIAWKTDCSFSFAHAVWVGSKVGLFVHGGYCGQIRVAFDLREWMEVPFDTVADAVRKSIVAECSVTGDELAKAGGDSLVWVSNAPRAAFDRRARLD